MLARNFWVVFGGIWFVVGAAWLVGGLVAFAMEVDEDPALLATFVAGGAGGDFWQECGAMAKRQTNVMLEPFTGGCHRGKLEALVGVLGAHRIFFATGYPNANPGAALGLLADARISDGEKQGIFQRNAVRLFNLALEG